MDRFECCGHRLDLERHENDLVARCQCGKWWKTVSLADGRELRLLVSRLVGEHRRHVDDPARV